MSSLSSADLPSHLLLLTCLRVLTVTTDQSFSHVRVSTVRVLAEIMGRYIQMLGNATKSFAEQNGRSSCNIQDALDALEGFGFDAQLCEEWIADVAKQQSYRRNGYDGQQQQAEGDPLVQMCERLLTNKQEPLAGELYSFRQLTTEEHIDLIAPPPEQGSSLFPPDFLQDIKPVLSSPIPSSNTSDSGEDGMQIDPAPRSLIERSLSLVQSMTGKDGNTGSLEPMPEEEVEEEAEIESLWLDPSKIPEFIPSFLPPLPGHERPKQTHHPSAAATSKPVRAPVEPIDTNARPTAAQQDPLHRPELASHFAGGVHVDPWKHAVPYDRSTLAEADALMGGSSYDLPVISNENAPVISTSKSSLPAYFHTYKELAAKIKQEPASGPIRTANGRQAAQALSEVTLRNASDSLFGAIAPVRPKFARKNPGWLPYPLRLAPLDPDPSFHPFDPAASWIESISIPLQNTEPLIPFPFSSAQANSTIFKQLVGPMLKASSSRLFNRLTRIGQPAPLGANGESVPYALEIDQSVANEKMDTATMLRQTRRVVPGYELRTVNPYVAELPTSAISTGVEKAIPNEGFEPPPEEQPAPPPEQQRIILGAPLDAPLQSEDTVPQSESESAVVTLPASAPTSNPQSRSGSVPAPSPFTFKLSMSSAS